MTLEATVSVFKVLASETETLPRKEVAANELAVIVDCARRDRSRDQFLTLVDHLTSNIQKLIFSSINERVQGGLLAILNLIAFSYEENEKKSIKFANFIRYVFESSNSATTLHLTASCFSRLTQSEKNLNLDFVKFQVKRAFEWLRTKGSHSHFLHSAALVIRSAAEHAPTVLSSIGESFISDEVAQRDIFRGLCKTLFHTKMITRTVGAEALNASLSLLRSRYPESAYDINVKLYQDIVCETFLRRNETSNQSATRFSRAGGSPIRRDASMEHMHGALLTLGVLIEQEQNFSESWFTTACDIVLEFKSSPTHDLLRVTAINLLPKVAKIHSELFACDYLRTALQDFLFVAIQTQSNKTACYNSMGNLALVIGDGILPYVAHQVVLAHEGLLSDVLEVRNGALRFVALLTVAVGRTLTENGLFDGLLTNMFLGGLNKTLVASLAQIEETVPSMRPYIHAHLIHTLSLMLSGSPFVPPESGTSVMKTIKEYAMLFHYHQIIYQSAEYVWKAGHYPEQDPAQISLALKVLSGFHFEMLNLLPFVSETVVGYLTHPNESVRVQSVHTCTRLLLSHATQTTLSKSQSFRLSSHVVSHILSLAITDSSTTVRNVAMKSLVPAFDVFLAPKEMVYQTCIGLGDEDFEVRRGAIRIVIRLARFNPGHVLPALHQTMIGLIECLGNRISSISEKQEAALMLGDLIHEVYSPANNAITDLNNDKITSIASEKNGISRNTCVTQAGTSKLVHAQKDSTQHFSQLILPYIPQALDILYTLCTSGEPLNVVIAVLRTIGNFALVNKINLTDFTRRMFPVIVEALHDQSSVYKRKVALKTLTQLVRASTLVVDPVVEHPALLDSLLGILNGGVSSPQSLRTYALQAIGTIGALDPFRNRTIRQGKTGLPGLPPTAVGDHQHTTTSRNGASVASNVAGTVGTNVTASTSSQYVSHAGNVVAKHPSIASGAQQTRTQETVATGGAGEGMEALKIANQQGRGSLAEYLDDPGSIFPPGSQHKDYYPAVVIQKLVEILRDESLSANHPLAILAMNHLFSSIGLGCVRFLAKVIPCLFGVLATGELETRRHVLRILAVIIGTVKQHFLPYMEQLTNAIVVSWSGNLEQVLILIEEAATALVYELAPWTQRFVQPLLDALRSCIEIRATSQPSSKVTNRDQRVAIKTKVGRLIETFRILGPCLVAHFQLVVPAILQVVESPWVDTEDKVQGLQTLLSFSVSDGFGPLVSPVFFSLQTLVTHPDATIRTTALRTLCAISRRFPHGLVAFERVLDQAVVNFPDEGRRMYMELKSDVHNHLVGRLSSRALQADEVTQELDAIRRHGEIDASSVEQGNPGGNRNFNPSRLTEIWDTSRCTSQQDWHAWFWDVAMMLLRESPQPALQACRELAQVHRPLAYSLFNAAFLSCWVELPGPLQGAATHAIATVYNSNCAPAEILQAFLNLAEYMEHDDQTLNIDLRNLCFYATQCQLYAKALHYKELEFHKSPSTSIEQLISIYTKLDLPEMAIGILQYALLQQRAAKESFQQQTAGGQMEYSDIMLNQQQLQSSNRFQLPAMDRSGSTKLIKELISNANSLREAVSDVSTNPVRTMSNRPDGAPTEPQRTNGGTNNVFTNATGGLGFTPTSFNGFEVQESWFEQLGRWEEAKKAYHEKLQVNRNDANALFRLVRCLSALGEEEHLLHLSSRHPLLDPSDAAWRSRPSGSDKSIELQLAALLAKSAWSMNQWDKMASFVRLTDRSSLDGLILRTVLSIHHNNLKDAHGYISSCRKLLDQELTALVGESYDRAYRKIVVVQQVAELEEICMFKLREIQNPQSASQEKAHLHSMWSKRIHGCQRNVEIWKEILDTRSLVFTPEEDTVNWIKFASICRNQGRLGLAKKTLQRLVPHPFPSTGTAQQLAHGVAPVSPELANLFLVKYAELKRQWAESDSAQLEYLDVLRARHRAQHGLAALVNDLAPYKSENRQVPSIADLKVRKLQVRCRLKLGNWMLTLANRKLDRSTIYNVLEIYQAARDRDKTCYKATQQLALMNFRIVQHYRLQARLQSNRAGNPSTPHLPDASRSADIALQHVVPAVEGFFHAVSLGIRNNASASVEDMLRLLTLWFDYGSNNNLVVAALREGLDSLPIGTWLQVVPQLIARINIAEGEAKDLLLELLLKLGKEHPHAVIYPILVALSAKENTSATAATASATALAAANAAAAVEERQRAGGNSLEGNSRGDWGQQGNDDKGNPAQDILDDLHRVNPKLVSQASLVSEELIRSAILWAEEWQDALEDAYKLYYSYRKPLAMLHLLAPLHERLNKGASTLNEHILIRECGRELSEAWVYMQNFQRTGNTYEAEQAWKKYKSLFNWIKKLCPSSDALSLYDVAPKLANASHLTELAVPGTYQQGKPLVSIRRFEPKMDVIPSKHHPRKVIIEGSNGTKYKFLLKGHEDLRQDERVMQLFGLVNSLLDRDHQTCEKDVAIQRYAVVPLSPNVGISSWLVHADTLHTLIKGFRDTRNIMFNIEYYLIKQFAPPSGFDNLTVIQKLEAFQNALENTTGSDIDKVLWHTSSTSELWLERRTNYSRSLATMCMVGYVLGLGDRHPSNIMLDRITGKVIHIDFGDCFEVAIRRDKFPEKVPFRLTRMLIKALEVSGIEGNFRFTCQSVMRVLRENRDSVMSMLEAFIHEPLIHWSMQMGYEQTRREAAAETSEANDDDFVNNNQQQAQRSDEEQQRQSSESDNNQEQAQRSDEEQQRQSSEVDNNQQQNDDEVEQKKQQHGDDDSIEQQQQTDEQDENNLQDDRDQSSSQQGEGVLNQAAEDANQPSDSNDDETTSEPSVASANGNNSDTDQFETSSEANNVNNLQYELPIHHTLSQDNTMNQFQNSDTQNSQKPVHNVKRASQTPPRAGLQHSGRISSRRASHVVMLDGPVLNGSLATPRRPRAQTEDQPSFARSQLDEDNEISKTDFRIGSYDDQQNKVDFIRFLDREGLSRKGGNQTALEVIQRVDDKLTGKDFGDAEITVEEQVQRLIVQATDPMNLCQAYFGWCAFW